MLFRETDRVQRTKASLCMVLFDIDDFGHWNSRLGSDACDELLCKVVSRTTRLLRSYDLFGRPGKDEFLVALPGCSAISAIMLAERLRHDVFSSPFRVSDQSIRLSACFGIASSHGRSPVVVLREAEQALQDAKVEGPESINCFDGSLQPTPRPRSLFLPLHRRRAPRLVEKMSFVLGHEFIRAKETEKDAEGGGGFNPCNKLSYQKWL